MRIAQVSPLFESVPPSGYGGTERVVSYLTEELVRSGHDVTLYASGDSVTGARLVSSGDRAIRLDPTCRDAVARHVLLLDRVLRDIERYDVVHWHLDYLHYPCARRVGVPCVTTLHGRLDLPDLVPLFAEFGELPLVSISDDQRRPVAAAHWAATVYHGLPDDLYPKGSGAGGYLAFLGRISPEKRVDRAIRIALATGHDLKIAAKVDKADQAYFEAEIEPMLDNPGIELVGEIGEADKVAFLGDARALLFPIDWPEPFGLVMIEALACGTPVVAWRRGSVPEVLEDGVTGYVVDDEAGAIAAVQRLDALSRDTCRATFERRFTIGRMAEDYLAVYRALQEGATGARVASK